MSVALSVPAAAQGSPLTTSALRPPSGVYSQLVISQQVPCAVSAIDASVQCWGAVSRVYSGQTLILPTLSVTAPSWLCALRTRHNPALTPSIACWSEDGAAAGVLYLPPHLTHTAFHSIAVTSFYICVQFDSDRTVQCFGDRTNPEASLFLAIPPPEVLGPVRAVGVVPGADQAYVWLLDGSLRAFGQTEFPVLPDAVNSSTYQWDRFQVAGVHGQAVIGTLTNGTRSVGTRGTSARNGGEYRAVAVVSCRTDSLPRSRCLILFVCALPLPPPSLSPVSCCSKTLSPGALCGPPLTRSTSCVARPTTPLCTS